MPVEGFRDLGFVTFLPAMAMVKRAPLYTVSRAATSELSQRQRDYIPAANIVG